METRFLLSQHSDPKVIPESQLRLPGLLRAAELQKPVESGNQGPDVSPVVCDKAYRGCKDGMMSGFDGAQH